jgi:ABC-type polysaccharide/polyol phosphate transport system ATPase subunit
MPTSTPSRADGLAIRLESVALRYRIPRERIRSFKEYTIRKIKRMVVFDEVVALRDFDLSVRPGETLGVIGRNGAGKSTLFKLIARVLYPTEGRVVVAGRIAPLLELGLGFHGELTGRENVLLQGALLGFSRKEMRRRLPGIVAWSELEEFIDSPIRTYSSGMTARLAFAVATDVEPDILLVDEALAVGDERFQLKCRGRIEAFRQAGKSVLLVSHDLAQVRENCRRTVWIHKGRLVRDGDSESVTAAYHAWSLTGSEEPTGPGVSGQP